MATGRGKVRVPLSRCLIIDNNGDYNDDDNNDDDHEEEEEEGTSDRFANRWRGPGEIALTVAQNCRLLLRVGDTRPDMPLISG